MVTSVLIVRLTVIGKHDRVSDDIRQLAQRVVADVGPYERVAGVWQKVEGADEPLVLIVDGRAVITKMPTSWKVELRSQNLYIPVGVDVDVVSLTVSYKSGEWMVESYTKHRLESVA